MGPADRPVKLSMRTLLEIERSQEQHGMHTNAHTHMHVWDAGPPPGVMPDGCRSPSDLIFNSLVMIR